MPELSNPFAPAGAESLRNVITPIAAVLTLASLAAAVAAPVTRFRRARGDERQQFKWFACAAVLLIVALVAPAALDPSGFNEPEGSTLLSGVLLSIALPLLPIAMGIAVLRHRLYDIDVIVNRTLVYGSLTAAIVGLYAFVVSYLSALFHTSANLAVSLVATGVVALAFAPRRHAALSGDDARHRRRG